MSVRQHCELPDNGPQRIAQHRRVDAVSLPENNPKISSEKEGKDHECDHRTRFRGGDGSCQSGVGADLHHP
ncbi:hypothetical protein VFJ44_11050, partial [Streptococcus sp. R3]